MSDLLVYSALITFGAIVIGIIVLKIVLKLLRREKEVDLELESAKGGKVIKVSSPDSHHEILQLPLREDHSHGQCSVVLLECGYLSTGIWYGLPNANMPCEFI